MNGRAHEEEVMPLQSYTIIHRSAKLSNDEQKLVTDWINKTIDSLEKNNRNEKDHNIHIGVVHGSTSFRTASRSWRYSSCTKCSYLYLPMHPESRSPNLVNAQNVAWHW
ncbi:heme-binding domain-containing protein [Pedobacter fastidiosus]|uniref:heme-binding domain-containing protein n=1 Tax=Pedobacter fastidiosus TaxID=2765361 RepID=UPI0036166341